MMCLKAENLMCKTQAPQRDGTRQQVQEWMLQKRAPPRGRRTQHMLKSKQPRHVIDVRPWDDVYGTTEEYLLRTAETDGLMEAKGPWQSPLTRAAEAKRRSDSK